MSAASRDSQRRMLDDDRSHRRSASAGAHDHFPGRIFAFTRDHRVLPLCDAIVAAKRKGRIPHAAIHQHQPNRRDVGRATVAMRRAGFRVLGFGVESFSQHVLAEFNKAQIYRHIEPMLTEALAAGITPFLDHHIEFTERACRMWPTRCARHMLVATGLRDRHVSLCDSVFRGGVRARSALLPHTVYPGVASPEQTWRGISVQDPADRSGGTRRHSAD